MSFCSLEFLLFLLVFFSLFALLPDARWRRGFFTVCNVGVCVLFHDARSLLALFLFLTTGYGVARLLAQHPRRSVLVGGVLAMVGAFLVLKRYDVMRPWLPHVWVSHSLQLVGLSYMLFRQIHVAVDVAQGQLPALTFGAYLNYQVNLFTLTSGPIQRFKAFQAFWDAPSGVCCSRGAVQTAFLRVFTGVIKVGGVAAFCLWCYTRLGVRLHDVLDFGSPASRGDIILWFFGRFYLFPLYVYMNFDGYCDIVIGGASLIGLPLPENFDRPYLARNMIDFWARWHRTLSVWIRDYLFTPLYHALATRWPSRAASQVFLCYFVALFLAGVWHGSTWNFVVFGLLHGAGVSVSKAWETLLLRRHGRAGMGRYLASRSIRWAAMALTFHFVCVTFVFFPSDMQTTWRILRLFLAAVFGGKGVVS